MVVVSEETQTISIARNGRINPVPDETQLLAILRDIFNLKKPAARGAAERPKADAPDAQS